MVVLEGGAVSYERGTSVVWGQAPCRNRRSGFTQIDVEQIRHTTSCITQLKTQGPSRTYNESKEKEENSTYEAVKGRF